jgi:hypothetical protein
MGICVQWTSQRQRAGQIEMCGGKSLLEFPQNRSATKPHRSRLNSYGYALSAFGFADEKNARNPELTGYENQ